MLAALDQLSAFSALLPIGAAGFRYRGYGPVLRHLAWFFFLSGLFDLGLGVSSYLGLKNMPVLHVFAAINLVFLCALYYHTLQGHWPRQLVRLAAGLGLGFLVYNALLPGGIWQFPSRALTAQSILFIGLALLYFYQLLHQQPVLALEKQPLFWINAAVLLYFSGNVFLFLLQDLLTQLPAADSLAGWSIHSVVNILANSFYALGLLCKPPPPP